jgi:hypothetical protein
MVMLLPWNESREFKDFAAIKPTAKKFKSILRLKIYRAFIFSIDLFVNLKKITDEKNSNVSDSGSFRSDSISRPNRQVN